MLPTPLKVLFIPAPGIFSHLIPLLALSRQLEGTDVEAAFLVPQRIHKLLRRMDVNVVDVDHQNFRTEMQAYGLFSPHIVIDDNNFSTWYATKLKRMPRITIQRTGVFPGGKPRNPAHLHSSHPVIDVRQMKDVTFLGLRQPQTLSDLFQAECKIIPGIPSIEQLPPALQQDPSYFYSGPLLMDDFLVEHLGTQPPSSSEASTQSSPQPSTQPSSPVSSPPQDASGLKQYRNFSSLQQFFDAHKERHIVYATFGTIATATPELTRCLRALIGRGIAVVSSIKIEELSEQESQLYYYAGYLPMHHVCRQVDVMVHQCGSGTYHYPLLHHVPTVTVGTRCYDRDDVAARLEELGVNVHLGAPEEGEGFEERMMSAVEELLREDSELRRRAKRGLEELNREIKEVQSNFDLVAVLHAALKPEKALESK